MQNPRCSVFIATSLDGFISRPDGSIDWLNEANATVPPGEDCGYGAFFASVDALVMGRHTFEQVLHFDPWPYASKPVIVLTTRPFTLPEHLQRTVSMTSEAPRTLVERLGREGKQHLYIDGGKTIQAFLAEGLIHQLTITVIPILLGAGRPLFGETRRTQKLHLVEAKAFEFGFLQSTYLVQAA